MDLNIPNFTPYSPTGNSIKSSNDRQTTNPQPKIDKSQTGFTSDAVTFCFSPEALKKSRSTENANSSESDSSKIVEDKEEPQLNTAEQKLVRKLQLTDLHVKLHEQQHLASAGSYARGGASFQFVIGPDGKSYAVGGEVALDTSSIPDNPQATITKAQVLRRAALAPSDPSGADRAIAAAATQMENKARTELMNQETPENETDSLKNPIHTGSAGRYFVKAYQNFQKHFQAGTLFDKIA